MEEKVPSEKEWLIMELCWDSARPLTSAEVVERLQKKIKISQKTVRVMINRLCQKKILDYTIDKKDSRVYHYFPVKSREDCIKEKSERFVESYFAGNRAGAVATLIQSCVMTNEQVDELTEILEKKKEGGADAGAGGKC